MATFKKYAQKLKKNKGQKLIIMLLINPKQMKFLKNREMKFYNK
jgi:hypothetical protein